MSPASLPDTLLAAGAVLHLPLDAGTVLVAGAGTLQVEEPARWLAGTLLPLARRLEEGQAHTVEAGGWVRITALGGQGARLRQLPPAVAPWPGVPLRRFVRLLLGA